MALLAALFFSVNDVTIKLLSDSYALHLVGFVRACIGLTIIVAIFMPLAGGFKNFRTSRLTEHLLRGLCVAVANLTFFLGLTTLDLADAVAIFFVAPLILTILSVVLLKETVGPWRWSAVGVGFVGALIVMRPGTESFQPATLFPLAAALSYAFIHIFARRLGRTESATTMAFYIQFVFVVVCLIFGLFFGSGWMDQPDSPTLSFLFRAWSWPAPEDYLAFAFIGVCIAVAGFLISFAYKVGEAALVAPFEYVALPLSVFWGIVVFGTWPDPIAWLGIALILASGLVIAWRENRQSRFSRKSM